MLLSSCSRQPGKPRWCSHPRAASIFRWFSRIRNQLCPPPFDTTYFLPRSTYGEPRHCGKSRTIPRAGCSLPVTAAPSIEITRCPMNAAGPTSSTRAPSTHVGRFRPADPPVSSCAPIRTVPRSPRFHAAPRTFSLASARRKRSSGLAGNSTNVFLAPFSCVSE